MGHFTVSRIGDEIIGTYDDGEHKLFLRQRATNDFLFDCACIVDNLSVKISKLDKKEN